MMKNTKIFLISAIGILAVSACGTGYYTSSTIRDDIYYRPTKAERASIVEQIAETKKSNTKHYTISDENGHSYSLETDLSYEQLLRKFDSPSYQFSFNYGLWYDPWYNPWWGINRWHSPFYYGGWYSWYTPFSYSFYNPFYYDNFLLYSWYDPWYFSSSWYYGGIYDPWYWNYGYLSPIYRPGFGPGPGPSHKLDDTPHYYGQRTGNNGSLISPSRIEAMRGVPTSTASSYSNSGVYTGRAVTTSRGTSTTSYSRSSGSYGVSSSSRSTGTTRSSSSESSSPSRSSGYSSGASSNGGFSSGNMSSGGGSISGGNAGGSGTHSGGGRR